MRMIDVLRGPERRGRKRYWTKPRIAKVLREWSQAHDGQSPILNKWIGPPSVTTVVDAFGSWNAAMEYVGLDLRPQHIVGYSRDSVYLQQRIDEGATLTSLAADYGITPQALGRRLARYRERDDAEHTVPYRGWRKGTTAT